MDRFRLFEKLRQSTHLLSSVEEMKLGQVDIADCLISILYLDAIRYERNGRNWKSKLIRNCRFLLKKVYRSLPAGKATISTSPVTSPGRNILFLPVEPTHLKQMLPVARALQKEKVESIFCSNRIKLLGQIANAGFNTITLHDQVILKGKYPSTADIADLVASYGKIQRLSPLMLKQCIYDNYPYFLSMYEQLNELLDQLKPSAVVAGYDITLEGRLLVYLAREKGIPSYCIQHGSIAGEPLDGIHIADHFLLYGTASVRYLEALPGTRSHCVVAGAPYLDEKLPLKKPAYTEHPVVKKLNLKSGRPYILIALSGHGHSTSLAHHQAMIKALMKASIKLPQYDFIVKLHRKDLKEIYQSLAGNNNSRLHVISNNEAGYPHDIFEWMSGAAMLITGTSSVATEAMLCRIPVLTLDLMNEYRDVDFIDGHCTLHTTSEKDLEPNILALFDTNHALYKKTMATADAYIEQYFHRPDGHGADRCAALIMQSVTPETMPS